MKEKVIPVYNMSIGDNGKVSFSKNPDFEKLESDYLQYNSGVNSPFFLPVKGPFFDVYVLLQKSIKSWVKMKLYEYENFIHFGTIPGLYTTIEEFTVDGKYVIIERLNDRNSVCYQEEGPEEYIVNLLNGYTPKQ